MKTWTSEIKEILHSNNLDVYFNVEVNKKDLIRSLKDSLYQKDIQSYLISCSDSPMLRYYNKINNFLHPKPYLSMPLSFLQRKRYAQCRLGILPIRLHLGRFERPRLGESDRLCIYCSLNECDDIIHFCLICPFNVIERNQMMSEIEPYKLQYKSLEQKLLILLNDPDLVRIVINFICT